MEYVYAINENSRVPLPDGGFRDMKYGEQWFADDPFVQAHPNFFSSTPVLVNSTIGRRPGPVTPLETRRRVRVRG